MNRVSKIIIAASIAVFAFSQTRTLSQARERSGISAEHKWKLEDLYDSDQAWNKAKAELVGQFDEVTRYQGKLAGSASELLACMEFDSRISKEFGRLFSYAAMKSDEDTRDSTYLAMKQQMQQLGTDYNSKAAFIIPEIAQLDRSQVDAFMRRQPGLKIFKMAIHDILRTKAHTLSEKEEKILAEAGLMADGPSSIYSVFSNAELPFPEIELSDGTVAKLTKAGYTQYRAVSNRADRQAVFDAFWEIGRAHV